MEILRDEAGALRHRRAQAADDLPLLTEVIRGTLRQRFVRCGKPTCHCRKSRGHGPVLYLSVTLGVGRTRQITIAPEDAAAVRRYVQNYARAWRLLERISTINRELLQKRLLRRQRKQPSPMSTKSKRLRKRGE